MWEGKRGGEVEKKGRSLVKFNRNSEGNDTLVFLLDLGLGRGGKDTRPICECAKPLCIHVRVYVCV